MGVELDEIPADLDKIDALLKQVGQTSMNGVIAQTDQMEANLREVDTAADGAKGALKGVGDSAATMNRAAQDVENLKN
jgi:hypothetical protein